MFFCKKKKSQPIERTRSQFLYLTFLATLKLTAIALLIIHFETIKGITYNISENVTEKKVRSVDCGYRAEDAYIKEKRCQFDDTLPEPCGSFREGSKFR